MSKETIRVPDVGSSDPVDVIEVSVKKGDSVEAEDTIVVLESDKASVEVPCPKAGTVLELLVKAGDRVKEGDPLLELDTEAGDGGAEDDQSSGDEPENEPAAEKDQSGDNEQGEKEEKAEPKADQKPAKKESGGTREQTIPAPDLGDIDEAEIIELSVSEGDTVEAEQTILVLESDKASLEIPSPAAGTVKKLLVKTGDKITSGTELMVLETAGGGEDESGDDQPAEETSGDSKPGGSKSGESESGGSGPARETSSTQDSGGIGEHPAKSGAAAAGRPSRNVHAGPAVRKLARETGVDLGAVPPSGPKDRILKEDVHAHIKQRMEQPAAAGGGGAPDLPEIDFSEFGPVERDELNKLRKVAARNLHRSWVTIPHVTQFDEADITELEAFRKSQNKALEKEGVKLTMLAFLVQACARALRKFPRVNSSLEPSGEALILKDYVHIGIAVDTPNGLVVPVLRDADKKGLSQIATEIGELAAKARDRKLSPADMKGATFSISSLGGIGGTAFTPIVNWPEVAILGVSRSDTKPVWDGNAFQPRLMLPLSFSYDHRVIDGADAARFTTYLSGLLGDMRRALL
ncbi:MAG: dihydrolipoyllysine-residue acetyltransferase [Alcanivorax sp.]|uniref:Acetyltransferase component of pyruvate dehydrogenase complex n=1 Tax=Alloalcanivorax venustensis ISO4 TaxID=1177184 RepID=A0ABS0AK49_9GAMM|nr:dihydrolipoyllysine-residue acetyltransferase [Alloalcanivorax venustensis]MBF5054506.1 pyruvate dehydrogenase, E2 component [Alloalcanivorax venustensis ISO4]